jgi:hypothetical protein
MTSPVGKQGTEVARGYATISINDQTAAGLANITSNATKSIRQIQSSSEILRNSLSGIFKGLGTNITETALGPLLNVGEGFARLSASSDDTGTKMSNMFKNVGAASLALGSTLLLVGAKEKQSTDQLKLSISNIGEEYGNYEKSIENVIATQAAFGHTSIQVDNALTTLTNSTHDTAQAVNLMGEASDLAAAKHESLDTAARQVAITIGGGGRLFKQYNIEVIKNTDGTRDYAAMNQKLADVLSGQATAASNNFGGTLRALGTEAENTFAAFGQRYGGLITGLGAGLSLLSGVLQVRYANSLRSAEEAQLRNVTAAQAGSAAVAEEARVYSASAAAIVQSAIDIEAANKASLVGPATASTGKHAAAGGAADAAAAATMTEAEASAAAAEAADKLSAAINRVSLAMQELKLSDEQTIAITDQMTAGLIGEAAAMTAANATAAKLSATQGISTKTTSSWGSALGMAGIAAVGIVVGLNMLSDHFKTNAADAQTASVVMGEYGQSADLTAEQLNKLGVQSGQFSSVLENAFHESNWTKLKDFKFGLDSIISTPFNSSSDDMKNFFKSADAGLSKMIADGRELEANNALQNMAKQAGTSVEDLLKKMPLLKEALDNTKMALLSQEELEAQAMGISIVSFDAAVKAVGKLNDAYAAGKTDIQTQIIANTQLQNTLGMTDEAWLKLATDLSSLSANNGGVYLGNQLRNVDESLQFVTKQFAHLTGAYSAWQNSVAAASAAEEAGAQNIQAAQESLSAARQNAADTAVSSADSIKNAEAAVAKQYVTDAKSIETAEDNIVQSQLKAKDAQVALDAARTTAAQNLIKAQQTLRDIPEGNDKAAIALQAAQLKASQDAVTAAQTALNNSTGKTQQQLIDAQNKINVQAAANAAAAIALTTAQAKYSVTDAQNALSDTLLANQQAQKDAADTIQKGVDGADGVLKAQKALVDANQAAQDSVQALADAKTAASDAEQKQLEALTKARESAAKANSQAAQAVEKAQNSLGTAQSNAQKQTEAATTAEEANRLKLNELEIQAGKSDDQVKAISDSIKNADTNLDIAMSSSGATTVFNAIVDIRRNIEEATLEAGGMPSSAATAKAIADIPYDVQTKDVVGYVTTIGGGRKPLATGGPAIGPGTGTSDDIPAWLSNGEHVWTAEEVRKAGGHQAVERMREMVMGRYADGGMVIDLNSMKLPDLMNASGAFNPHSGGMGAVADYSGGANVRGYAAMIIGEAKRLGLGLKGAEIGLITALAESGLKNYANSNIPSSLSLPHDAVGSDHYSLGLFQQQSGPFGSSWGTVPQVMNPVYATDRFFKSMVGVGNWQNMDAGQVAQDVQVSAFPDAYDRQMGAALSLINSLGFDSGGILAPGKTITNNQTGKPEAIFTFEQAQAIADMAKSGGQSITIQNLTMQIDPSTIKDVSDLVDMFKQLPLALRAANGATLGKMAVR